MIISHRYRFIFIHCRKVAGSSMTVFLSRYLGPFDICIGVHKERLDLGIRSNLRFYFDLFHPRAVREYCRVRRRGKNRHSAINEASKCRYKVRFGRDSVHPDALAVQKNYPDEWSRYFKFCFVRNPYERAVSDYYFRCGKNPSISFLDFLKQSEHDVITGKMPRRLVDNWPFYTINDQPCVDFIGRYETLEADLQCATNRAGLHMSDGLPRLKPAGRKYDHRSYYTQSEFDIVSRLFEKEILYFNYEL